MRIGEVTKEKAEELANQLLGTRKLIKKDEHGYYFQSGRIRMRVSPWHIKGNKKVFQTFFLAGNGTKEKYWKYSCGSEIITAGKCSSHHTPWRKSIMSIEEMKNKGGIYTVEKEFWRSMYKEADRKAEYYKKWSAALLFLLGFATFAIMYLLKFGG